jgi:hypothetical protein
MGFTTLPSTGPAITQDGPEKPRHRTGSSHGVRHIPIAQPYLFSGREIGGDRREWHRQLGERALHKLSLIQVQQPVAFEEAAPQSDVGEPDHTPPV